MWRAKPAVVETGFVGARGAFDPGGLRMAWREEIGQLGPEDGEGRHAKQRGQMPGTRIVADEAIGRGERRQQRLEVGSGIVEHGHLPACGAQAVGQEFESVARPDAHRMAGAKVDHHAASRRGGGPRRGRGRFPLEFLCQGRPVLGTVRLPRGGQHGGQQHT